MPFAVLKPSGRGFVSVVLRRSVEDEEGVSRSEMVRSKEVIFLGAMIEGAMALVSASLYLIRQSADLFRLRGSESVMIVKAAASTSYVSSFAHRCWNRHGI